MNSKCSANLSLGFWIPVNSGSSDEEVGDGDGLNIKPPQPLVGRERGTHRRERTGTGGNRDRDHRSSSSKSQHRTGTDV